MGSFSEETLQEGPESWAIKGLLEKIVQTVHTLITLSCLSRSKNKHAIPQPHHNPTETTPKPKPGTPNPITGSLDPSEAPETY